MVGPTFDRMIRPALFRVLAMALFPPPPSPFYPCTETIASVGDSTKGRPHVFAGVYTVIDGIMRAGSDRSFSRYQRRMREERLVLRNDPMAKHAICWSPSDPPPLSKTLHALLGTRDRGRGPGLPNQGELVLLDCLHLESGASSGVANSGKM